jgi:ssDNA-binding Zn-finger/Zn-ribbon topoisomerase 1
MEERSERMEATLQGIFNASYAGYREGHKVSLAQAKAAEAIMKCQSDRMGAEAWVCPNGDHIEHAHHSCRHRSCPRCHGARTHDWLEMVQARLLPCDHYHVIFTLPHELNDLWGYNRAWCADHLFRAAAETLRELLADERHLGAEVGLLASLHTWGRTLSFHPHLHLLVSGGGLHAGEWRAARRDYLLPVAVLKAKFRGKWLAWLGAGYERGEIKLPEGWTPWQWKRVLRSIARKRWNVRIEGAYRHGDGVAVYLSRYVRGGPIKDARLLRADGTEICFWYQDHHDGRAKHMTLSPEHFLARVLWHVPVPGQHNVRYYGLYVPGAGSKRDQARAALGKDPEQRPEERPPRERHCPACGAPLQRAGRRSGKISYIGRMAVQQGVEAAGNAPQVGRSLRTGDPPRPFFGPAPAA